MILKGRWRIRRAISCAHSSSSKPGFLFDLTGGVIHRRWEEHERCGRIRRLRSEWMETSSSSARLRLRLRICAVGLGICGVIGFMMWAWTETSSYIRNKLLSWDP